MNVIQTTFCFRSETWMIFHFPVSNDTKKENKFKTKMIKLMFVMQKRHTRIDFSILQF